MRRLASDRKIGYVAALVSLAAILPLFLIDEGYIRWAAAPLFAFMAAALYTVIKKRSILSFYKRQVSLIIALIAFLYVMLNFTSGFMFGFVKSDYGALTWSLVFLQVIPIAIIIVFNEFSRSIMLGVNSKAMMIISYSIGVLSELLIAGGVRSINSSFELADFIGMTLFPALSSNLLFTYLTKRYGSIPAISYRLLIALSARLIPVAPNLSRFIPAFVLLILPLLTMAFIDLLYEKKKKNAAHKDTKIDLIIFAVLLVLLIAFVLLVTCQFRFGIIVIGSESMADNINKGDAVVFERYESGAELGDVVIFTSDSSSERTVHRIVDIIPLDGKLTYVTKGDANPDPDPGFITDANIIATVRFKISYIGYPTLWMRDMFKQQVP